VNAPPGAAGGYNETAFQKLFAVEEKHFWFRARNTLIAALASRAIQGIKSPSILEIGCGTGNVLGALNRARAGGVLIGLDFKAEGLTLARKRSSLPLVQADANFPPFSIQFDLIGMFDVLEHIPDDSAALRSALKLIRPGGKLLLTVPAHMKLWSYADVAARHCRRYETSELRDGLVSAGFEVEFIGPFMMLLYPVLRLWRTLNRGNGETEFARFERDLTVVPILNQLAAWGMTAEARWVAGGHRLPFGSSLVAIAVKPQNP
jgi:SAM-dependent methyltransferase